MRTELKRVGAVDELNNGYLAVKQRFFRPIDLDEQLERALDQALRGLALCVDHNTGNTPENSWVERLAYSTKIRMSTRSICTG